ncbi:hypothetical protein FSP39_003182 [Pinctada imbricata]|uniref:RBR-type E3 ubiquitin transferase n=1 Tax=Pinctada imbricata TaxID=66713 RepID=A0AA88XKS4_PINIB|nr:hypothetical protein FSP39_003182 [Pinctada imbricata]
MRKRDSEVVSVSSGNSRGSERRRASRFSLRRIFYPGAHTSKSRSRVSLDSDSGRSEISISVPTSDKESVYNTHYPSDSHNASNKKSNSNIKECPLCLTERPNEDFPDIMTCHHRSCISCLQTYLKIEITESRVNISCPECTEKFHPNDICNILQNSSLMSKYEDFMVRRVLVSDPDARWCPAPDCGYAVIATGCAGCPKIKCERPGCDTHFCYHCKQYWHPNKTCDSARAERLMRSASISYSHETDSQKGDIKPCPRCGAFIMKMNDGSCNHMACPVCGAEFCWLCMKEISDLHYLSPSGCTFWGKKPWSRKKKILWQLGTLVGAPVGITLIAGIAVPAMIIGIPVWVGRKLHSKYEHSSRHRRNLAITGGVAASVLVSPIVAGLTVGIGVPILLAYVYGVVPISLCRSGGCGVSTSGKGGVRFDFDEENENVGPSGPYADTHSVGTVHTVANPSIAPSIGDASLGMTNSLSASGSHIDRIGVIRDESDRDSASNRAIGGISLNGSICGASLVGGYHTKLEVHADVASNHNPAKRASISSESANLSIGDKSATVSFGDDASTKALAGSIAGYRQVNQRPIFSFLKIIDKDNVSIATSPYEVQVDLPSTSMPSQGTDTSEESSSVTTPSGTDKPSNTSGQGSPVSSCSMKFCQPEEGKPNLKKCKRSVLGLCERGAEQQSVHFADQVSLQSFHIDDIVSQSLSEDSEERELNEGGDGVFDGVQGHVFKEVVCGKTPDTFSSRPSKFDYAMTASMPEVESDKPSKASRKTVSTTALTSKEYNSDNHAQLCKSKSHEDCAISKEIRPSRIRHRSCEIALESGRISPASLSNEKL